MLLIAEVEGRNRSTIEEHRRRDRFPAGKTFDIWDGARSSIPAAPSKAFAPSNGSAGPRTW